mmetsp:Transcript_56736/g.159274  ORF Transcript_56736/g.159274 Transcript_56736/m.159274 type:complete len:295 (+) Transcript_56736:406-1290(+)
MDDDEVPGLALHRPEARVVQALALGGVGGGGELALPLPCLAVLVQGLEDHLRRRRVAALEVRRVADEQPPHGLAVGAGPRPKAAVLQRGRVQRQPEAEASLPRRGVQEGRVLVGRHLATDRRLLENVHGLRQHRIPPAQLRDEAGDLVGVGVATEHRVRHVQAVPHFVQRTLLGNALLQTPVVLHRTLFQEKVDAVGAVQEVVGRALAFHLVPVGGEDRGHGLLGVPLPDELQHARPHALQLLGRREPLDDEEPVPLEQLLPRQLRLSNWRHGRDATPPVLCVSGGRLSHRQSA